MVRVQLDEGPGYWGSEGKTGGARYAYVHLYLTKGQGDVGRGVLGIREPGQSQLAERQHVPAPGAGLWPWGLRFQKPASGLTGIQELITEQTV